MNKKDVIRIIKEEFELLEPNSQFDFKWEKLKKPSKWFDEYGNLKREIPKDVVEECSQKGSVDLSVSKWVDILEFDPPHEMAIDYLRKTGGWSVHQLQKSTYKSLAMRVLWIACCDIAENGEWFGLQESKKINKKVIKEALSEKGMQTVEGWCREFGYRKAGKKLLDGVLRKQIGLTSDDLPDTTVIMNGLDEIEQMLKNRDYQNAYTSAKTTAIEMLEEEGHEGLMEAIIKEEVLKELKVDPNSNAYNHYKRSLRNPNTSDLARDYAKKEFQTHDEKLADKSTESKVPPIDPWIQKNNFKDKKQGLLAWSKKYGRLPKQYEEYIKADPSVWEVYKKLPIGIK